MTRRRCVTEGNPLGLFPQDRAEVSKSRTSGKGKGVLIHTLTEGNGMPLANSTTAAQSRMAQVAPQKRRLLALQAAKSEREQIVPLLDKIKLKTQRGRADRRLTTTLQALLAANLVDQRKE